MDEQWADELSRLGGSIHQDDAAPLDAEQDAAQQAGNTRYFEMLVALGDDSASRSDPQVAAAVLWSLHPIDDYGIYAAAYGVLKSFAADALVHAALAVLPEWLQRRGDHDSIRWALAPIADDSDLRARFIGGIEQWDERQRSVVVASVSRWAREDGSWEPIVVALGGSLPSVDTDPIPVGWPDDWRAATQDFRDRGGLQLAWDDRDVAGSCERVLAILELEHGPRWRDVPALLNPIRVRRRAEIPRFVRAFDDLPESSRDRIRTNIERAWPDFSDWLDEHRDARP